MRIVILRHGEATLSNCDRVLSSQGMKEAVATVVIVQVLPCVSVVDTLSALIFTLFVPNVRVAVACPHALFPPQRSVSVIRQSESRKRFVVLIFICICISFSDK